MHDLNDNCIIQLCQPMHPVSCYITYIDRLRHAKNIQIIAN